MTGADPNTKWLAGCLLLDDKKFVKTGADLTPDELLTARWPLARRPYLMETTIPGVFCVGDARSGSVKRVASAVGEGSICVQLVHRAFQDCSGRTPFRSMRSAMADQVPIPLDLFDHLRRAGLDVDAILRRAKLPRSRFSVPNPQGTTAEFFALWRSVEEANDDPALGLRIGVAVLPDEDNVVSLAAMHSATLGEGLEKLARYKRLVCPEEVSIDVEEGEARMRFEWLLADGAPPALLTDIIFAGVTNLAQRGTQTPVRPQRLEFIRHRANEAMLRRHSRCELRFDAPHDLLVFEEGALALPMVNRNAQLLGVLLPGLERAVEQDERARTLVDDVRMALSERMCGDRPALSKVARSSRHERAHDAAPPRRAGHDVSGRP